MGKGVRQLVVVLILIVVSIFFILHINPFLSVKKSFQKIFQIFNSNTVENNYLSLLNQTLMALDDDPLVYYEHTKQIVREACVAIEKRRDSSPTALLISSVQLFRERDFAKAFDQLYEIITRYPNECEAFSYLGYIGFKYDLIPVDKSVEYLKKAIECNPAKARYHSFLATVYRYMFQDTKDEQYLHLAEENFETAIQLEPDDINAYNNYANFLVEIGEYEKAEENYRKAIAIYPEHAKPYYNLACLKTIEGDKQSAIKYLQEAINRNPDFRYDAKNDPDLQILRDTPEFQELIYNYPY